MRIPLVFESGVRRVGPNWTIAACSILTQDTCSRVRWNSPIFPNRKDWKRVPEFPENEKRESIPRIGRRARRRASRSRRRRGDLVRGEFRWGWKMDRCLAKTRRVLETPRDSRSSAFESRWIRETRSRTSTRTIRPRSRKSPMMTRVLMCDLERRGPWRVERAFRGSPDLLRIQKTRRSADAGDDDP